MLRAETQIVPQPAICLHCKQIEGETKHYADFTFTHDTHIACGKIYRHGCGCYTTARCEHGTGTPETDRYFGTFTSIEEIKGYFLKISIVQV